MIWPVYKIQFDQKSRNTTLQEAYHSHCHHCRHHHTHDQQHKCFVDIVNTCHKMGCIGPHKAARAITAEG